MPATVTTRSPQSSSPIFRSIIYACFLLSGAAGLIYEVVWARQLGLFIGITSVAHTAVITAYMAGLAAGSLFFGRYADRGIQQLRLYAWLEVGVGLYAAMTPWLFGILQATYADIAGTVGVAGANSHLPRFLIAMAALLIPTFLMGGTLPLLVRGFVRSLPDLGSTISWLYGLNTLGAMLGTLLAGYLLLPAYGIRVSIFTGVGINLGIAVLVLVMLRFRLQPAGENDQASLPQTGITTDAGVEPPGSMSAGARALILIAFGLAGFAALLTQVAWIKALILVVGGSVYAFTITLASFLAGIGLGSLSYNRWWSVTGATTGEALDKMRLARAALLAGLVGFLILLGLPLIGKLPGWFLAGYSAGMHENFAMFQVFIFSLSFAIMFLPCLCMGALFPLVTVIWARNSDTAGRGVGAAYAINTFGTIFGALLGGLLILPWLGIHYSVLFAAGIYLVVAGLFWWLGGAGLSLDRRIPALLIAAAVFGLITSWVPPWNQSLMSSGAFFRPDLTVRATKSKSLEDAVKTNELLYYKEGLDGVVSVTHNGGQYFLQVNGKTDASSVGDLPTQVLLGQIPLMLHPGPTDVLIIGLGSGVTAGSVATHPSVENITVLEISQEVIEASAFFDDVNGHPLSDPRLTLVNADARNYLLATRQKFDVIVSEPSNPWISGISNLFTREFFKLASEHLAAGGLMSQWLHSYGLSEQDLKTILKTYREVFPRVSIWYTLSGDWVLVGSDTRHHLDAERVRKLLQEPAIPVDLERVGISDIRDLVRHFIMGNTALDRFVDQAHRNSDDHPVIEFNAPKYLYRATTQSNLLAMTQHLENNWMTIPVTNMAQRRDNGIDIPSMSISIGLLPKNQPERLNASWLLSRHTLDIPDSFGVGIASERRLQWHEGSSEFRLQAILRASINEVEEQRAFELAQSNQAAGRGGEINMPGDHVARWIASGEGAGDRVELIVSWDCPATRGGFTRYALHAVVPGAGEQSVEATLVELTDRFRCY